MEEFCRVRQRVVSDPEQGDIRVWATSLRTINMVFELWVVLAVVVSSYQKWLTSFHRLFYIDVCVKTFLTFLFKTLFYICIIFFLQMVRVTLLTRGRCLRRCTRIRTKTACPYLRCRWNVSRWKKEAKRPGDNLTSRPCTKQTVRSGGRAHRLHQQATARIIWI